MFFPIFEKNRIMPSLQTAFLSLLFLLFCPYICFGQVKNGDGSIDCTEPTIIEVSKEHIQMSSSGDYESLNNTRDPVVFYKENDKYSFWYKIIINHSCDLQFDIFPSDESDFYNFFLYRYDGSNFCGGIINYTVVPFRANVFEITGSKGKVAGISKSIKGERLETKHTEDYIYYRPRHQIIDAQQGHIYYLNVHHLVGDDCGHTIEFSSCEKSLSIEAKHKPCYIPKIASEPTRDTIEKLGEITSIASISALPIGELEAIQQPSETHGGKGPSGQVERKKDVYRSITLKPIVFDERTEKPLKVDFEIIESSTGKIMSKHVNEDGMIEVDLLTNEVYKMKYSSLGYEPHQIEVSNEKRADEVVLPPVYLKPEAVGRWKPCEGSCLV